MWAPHVFFQPEGGVASPRGASRLFVFGNIATQRTECYSPDIVPANGTTVNFICDSRTAGFHGIFSAGRASENSGENLPLKMAPIVVEVRGGEVGYIPGIASDGEKFFGFMVYRDEAKGNCLHVTRYLGEVRPPFSAKS